MHMGCVRTALFPFNMNYTILDLKQHPKFKYKVLVPNILEFHTARQWMSQSYGLAEHLDRDTLDNKHWGFEIELKNYSIYLKSDDELSWFKIKHGGAQ